MHRPQAHEAGLTPKEELNFSRAHAGSPRVSEIQSETVLSSEAAKGAQMVKESTGDRLRAACVSGATIQPCISP